MLYTPGVVSPAELDIAQGPYFGGEFLVYVTQKAAVLAYELEVLTADPVSAQAMGVTAEPGATLPGAGADLQIGARTPLLSTVALTLSLAGTNAGNAVTNLSATIQPPSRSANQGFNFERGVAADLIVDNGQAKSIQSATIIGGAPGQKFGVYQLPDQADYTFIGCTTEIEFNTRSRMAKGVDCKMESDAFVKRGKTQPGMLSIGSKLKGFRDGLTRFDGQKCTCMLIGVKDGQVFTDRIVFTQFVPTIKPKLPEGDGEAVNAGEGKFVEALFFVAGDGLDGAGTDSSGMMVTDSGGDVILI